MCIKWEAKEQRSSSVKNYRGGKLISYAGDDCVSEILYGLYYKFVLYKHYTYV